MLLDVVEAKLLGLADERRLLLGGHLLPSPPCCCSEEQKALKFARPTDDTVRSGRDKLKTNCSTETTA